MEIEAGSRLSNEPKPIIMVGNGNGSGRGPYDPGIQMNGNSSAGPSYIDNSLATNGNDDQHDMNINGATNSHIVAARHVIGRNPVLSNEQNTVNEFVNAQDAQRLQTASGLSSGSSNTTSNNHSLNITTSMDNEGIIAVSGQTFMDASRNHAFALDPSTGPHGNQQRSLSPHSFSYHKNDYSQQENGGASASLVSSAQQEFYHQQALSQLSLQDSQLQLQQAQHQQHDQRQSQHIQQQHYHQLQSGSSVSLRSESQHQQGLQHQRHIQHTQSHQVYKPKVSNHVQSHQNYHIQNHPHPHQLQQSTSANDEDELFARHMSPNHQSENSTLTSQSRVMLQRSHQATAAAVAAAAAAAAANSPYSELDMVTSSAQYQSNMHTGQLSTQLTRYGDSLEATAASMGMEFSTLRNSSPLSGTPIGMMQNVNNGTPGSSAGQGRKRKASAMSSLQADYDSIADIKLSADKTVPVPLADLAVRVREEENGSSAEKFRQTFAMAWLKHSCELSPDAAVPRNRIYARYVELCAEHNLKPLNPASFGKLVRVAYPDIKTRRLGVRGQSKYHYCGFRLIGEQNNPTGITPTGTPGRFGNSPDRYVRTISLHFDANYSSLNIKNQLGFESSSFNSFTQSQQSTPSHVRFPRTSSTPLSEFDSKPSRDGGMEDYTHTSMARTEVISGLRFHASFNDFTDVSLSPNAHESFSIPPLTKHLKNEIDPDFASTLHSLYLSHCRALIESLRFMHIKKFVSLIGSFVGGLTAPIQKLLHEKDVVTWITHSDWIMYKVSLRN